MKRTFKYILGMVLGIAFSARADLYMAESVEMSGTGANPVEAKNNAITAGELAGFNQMITTLIGAQNEALFERPNDDEVLAMVRDISILEEKKTGTSYWGKMNVRFKKEAVQELFKKNNQTYLKKAPPVYWLIPVFKAGAELRTLEDENPFYQTLKTQSKLSDAFQILLPNGDINELISVEHALADQDFSETQKMATQNGAERVLIIETLMMPNGEWEMKPVSYTGAENIFEGLSVQGKKTDSLWDGWQRLNQKMDLRWQSKNTFSENESITYYARINLAQMSNWGTLEKELTKLGFLENITLQGAMPGQVLVRFDYPHSTDELTTQLDKVGWFWQPDAATLGTLKRKDFYENTL
ncbi:MAG: hypothetical protein ACI4OR_01190 [Alphaproteobacteria bacterium]